MGSSSYPKLSTAPRNSQELWRLQQEMLKAGSAPGLMEAQLKAFLGLQLLQSL
jgi:hypothetical protein